MTTLRRAALPAAIVIAWATVASAVQGPGGPGGRGGRGGPPEPPPTAQAAATVDLEGYWVSLVTEDWHWRMSLPEAGDVASIPFTNDEEARAELEAWDPVADEAAGLQCKAYGAPALMRIPTRVHIEWENPEVLRVEIDAGMQVRRFLFNDASDAEPGEPDWQGFSVAEWEPEPGGRGRGGRGGGGPPDADSAEDDEDDNEPAVAGSLKVVTTNLRPGYLRKNGVPYSDQTTVTEYYHRTPETYGETYMIVTTIVEDPVYLNGPFITSSHFRKLPDTVNGWNPTPCSVY
jgi:hypothetical protein